MRLRVLSALLIKSKTIPSSLFLSSQLLTVYTQSSTLHNSPGGTKSTMAENPDYKKANSIYEFTANDIKGQPVSLEKYKGHVCIIVNVASKCGYAKTHYEELNELYNEYSETKGLRILAFPCNQFAHQESGDAETICNFVAKKNVKFDMFEKIDVNGSKAHPLWNYLKHKQGGFLTDGIKWNFTKFIVDKNGQPVERHGPNTNPKDLVKSLAKYW